MTDGRDALLADESLVGLALCSALSRWTDGWLAQLFDAGVFHADPHPGNILVNLQTGEITFIAKQAEFTPRNVQTPEERSKQVFRIKVLLADTHDRLRPGMAADVWFGDQEGSP